MRILFTYLTLSLFLFLGCNSKSLTTRIDLDAAEFKTKISNPNTVILDVRTPEETANGIIPGAIEIDVKKDDFKTKIQALDKDKTYLVYCRSGRRSVKACDIMEAEGFKDLYNLKGGYNGWPKE